MSAWLSNLRNGRTLQYHRRPRLASSGHRLRSILARLLNEKRDSGLLIIV